MSVYDDTLVGLSCKALRNSSVNARNVGLINTHVTLFQHRSIFSTRSVALSAQVTLMFNRP